MKENIKKSKLYDPYKIKDENHTKTRAILKAVNATYDPIDISLLRPYFKDIGTDAIIIPPLYFDHGHFISIGKHFYANSGLIILDEAEVIIGNDVLIGPRVSIYTPNHPLDPTIRKLDLEIATPVVIEDGVWIGGDCVINPGVTIGKNSVIGANSTVTHDIPSGVIACGSPCRVLRKIGASDEKYWQDLYEEYRSLI